MLFKQKTQQRSTRHCDAGCCYNNDPSPHPIRNDTIRYDTTRQDTTRHDSITDADTDTDTNTKQYETIPNDDAIAWLIEYVYHVLYFAFVHTSPTPLLPVKYVGASRDHAEAARSDIQYSKTDDELLEPDKTKWYNCRAYVNARYYISFQLHRCPVKKKRQVRKTVWKKNQHISVKAVHTRVRGVLSNSILCQGFTPYI